MKKINNHLQLNMADVSNRYELSSMYISQAVPKDIKTWQTIKRNIQTNQRQPQAEPKIADQQFNTLTSPPISPLGKIPPINYKANQIKQKEKIINEKIKGFEYNDQTIDEFVRVQEFNNKNNNKSPEINDQCLNARNSFDGINL